MCFTLPRTSDVESDFPHTDRIDLEYGSRTVEVVKLLSALPLGPAIRQCAVVVLWGEMTPSVGQQLSRRWKVLPSVRTQTRTR
jgi:hypothetical protein